MTKAPETITCPSRISIPDAFQLLLDDSNMGPYETCELINTALRTGRVKLFADGAEVNPSFIATHLIVTAAAGTAKVTALRALDRSDYEWTVTGIERLLKPEPKPVKRWLADDVEWMRKKGRLRLLISKTKIADDIEPRMQAAADRGEVERALSSGTIRNWLSKLL